VGGNGRCWVRAFNPRSMTVKVNAELIASAHFWLAALQHSSCTAPLVTPPVLVAPCAADAMADTSIARIGGWFATIAEPQLASIKWFSLQLSPLDFPESWQMNPIPQRNIACYELLAQIILLKLRADTWAATTCPVTIQQLSDNSPTIAASGRLYSSATPMRYFVQLLAWWASKLRVNLQVVHIPGKDNIWADHISRADPRTCDHLSPSLDRSPSLQSILEPFLSALL
jgi:hypothetical protein